MRIEARRRWPRAISIDGKGGYACVSHCRPGITVELFESRAAAAAAKALIDDTGCGGGCMRRHGIFYIGKGRPNPPAICSGPHDSLDDFK
jgi:hypothetical protein